MVLSVFHLDPLRQNETENQKRPGYLPGLTAVKKIFLTTRLLDFILLGSPNRIKVKLLRRPSL